MCTVQVGVLPTHPPFMPLYINQYWFLWYGMSWFPLFPGFSQIWVSLPRILRPLSFLSVYTSKNRERGCSCMYDAGKLSEKSMSWMGFEIATPAFVRYRSYSH